MSKMWDKWEGRKRSNGLNNCAVLEEGNMFCNKVTKEKYKLDQARDKLLFIWLIV